MARQGKIYSKVRAVDMSSNDGDAGSRLPILRDCEGEQGTLVPKGAAGGRLSEMGQSCLMGRSRAHLVK